VTLGAASIVSRRRSAETGSAVTRRLQRAHNVTQLVIASRQAVGPDTKGVAC
jgi:hypothetical protein